MKSEKRKVKSTKRKTRPFRPGFLLARGYGKDGVDFGALRSTFILQFFRSENEFRTAVEKYMVFCNEQRLHDKNGYQTPFKKELDFLNEQALLELKSIRQGDSDRKTFLFAVSVLSFFIFVSNLKSEIKSPQTRMKSRKKKKHPLMSNPRGFGLQRVFHAFRTDGFELSEIKPCSNALGH